MKAGMFKGTPVLLRGENTLLMQAKAAVMQLNILGPSYAVPSRRCLC